ncbi:hypothetical protein B0H15DRAFT_507174 [Mycena belliarum]|uniref:DUF3494 domain-containing protein n=1 Tax=Mycena belliarum TaxID=1033014 RepID=A0AAD6UIC5_9AGAR|nr:hypothetical protein B0H15DRAFT_507174 [Mycena belliae]
MPTVHPKIAAFVLLAIIGGSLAAGPAPVLLGTAGNFAVLAKTGVSTVPNSAVNGNVGVSPDTVTSLTGFSLVQDVSRQFWTSTQVNGRLMGATDALPTPGLLTVAVLDMQAAFTDAMNRPLPDFVSLKAGLIGGSILVPGLYKWTTGVNVATDITIAGGPADTWIFQISGSYTQASNVRVTLVGGALSQNIVWAIAGTVTVGGNAIFQGNILAKTNVVLGTNAIDNGCIYAQTAVSLQKATVLCSGGVAVPPPSSSAPATSTLPPTVTSNPTSTSPSTTYSAKCTPTAAPCYTVAFEDLDASIHGDDYLSYILTDTVQECIDFCACRPGCVFANPYFDNNAKNTTMLTCAFYAGCHTAADATNTGGQTEPDGSLSTISSSSGYCLAPCDYRRY